MGFKQAFIPITNTYSLFAKVTGLRYPLSIALLLLLNFTEIQAQNSNDSVMTAYIEQLKTEIEKQDYSSAKATLKNVFSLKTTLPDAVAFYYGLTMFKTGNYKAAKDAFDKYLSLTRDEGEFYERAIHLHQESQCRETGYFTTQEICEECEGQGTIDSKCRICKGTGKEFCPVCGGKGVAKHKDDFGDKYHNCEKCKASGFILCTRCEGSRMEKTTCAICNGKGILKLKKSCQ